MKRNLFVILFFLLLAGASYAQPVIDSMVVTVPGLNDTIYVHGKFGTQKGKVFLDTSEMQIYKWTDTIITAQLLPFIIGDRAGCGPITVSVNGMISNARILSMGWVQGNIFPPGDTLIYHSTPFNCLWRYDFHSFFLNHKGITKLAVPTTTGNAIFDFQQEKVDINYDLQILLDSNYNLPSVAGYSWYRPSHLSSWYYYELNYGCSAPIDTRRSYREFLSVKAVDHGALSLICFPNPTSKDLNISYSLSQRGNARLILYDLEGRVIRESATDAEAGEQVMKWDMSQVASGSYVLGLVIGGETKFQIVKVMR